MYVYIHVHVHVSSVTNSSECKYGTEQSAGEQTADVINSTVWVWLNYDYQEE